MDKEKDSAGSSSVPEPSDRNDRIGISIVTDTVPSNISSSPSSSPSVSSASESASASSLTGTGTTPIVIVESSTTILPLGSATIIPIPSHGTSATVNDAIPDDTSLPSPRIHLNPAYRTDNATTATSNNDNRSSSSSTGILHPHASNVHSSSSLSPLSFHPSSSSSSSSSSSILHSRPPIETLPDDTLSFILRYVSSTDLSRLAQVNHQFYTFTNKNSSLWFNLYVQDFDIAPQDIGTLQLGARRAYVQRLVNRQKRIQQLTERKTKEEQENIAERKQLRLGIFLVIFNIITWLYAPFLSLFIFSVLVAYKLDGTSFQSTPWNEIFIPLYIWILLAIISSGIACYIHRLHYPDRLSIWYGQAGRLSWTPPRLIMDHIFGGNRKGILYGCTLSTLLLFIVPLLVMKLDNVGGEEYTWAMTFIPVWLITLLFPFGIRLGWCRDMERDSKILLVILLITLYLPFVIVLILSAVSLDNNFSIPLSFVFIPFWIINALIGALLWCHCGFTVYRLIRGRDRDDLLFFVSMVVAVTIIVLPPLLTLIFLTFRIDNIGDHAGDMSWKRIIGAVWFTLILMILLSCGAGNSACTSYVAEPLAERRQTEPDPFSSRETMDRMQDMYRRHIQSNIVAVRGGTNGLPRT